VKVDNTAPHAELEFTLGMGALCSKGSPGIIFTGEYTATDAHFHSFGFSIYPNDASLNVQLPSPSGGLSTYYGGAIADPGVSGGAFTLDTTGMAPCGYALILTVWDRTIVNSSHIGRQSNDSVGFCLA
jgi:hypothetical protein